MQEHIFGNQSVKTQGDAKESLVRRVTDNKNKREKYYLKKIAQNISPLKTLNTII